jgi:Na+/H+ antiporter NhaD/arsenite permease-like protein
MQFPLLAALSTSADALQSTTDPVSQVIVASVIVAVFALLTRETAHRVLVIMGAVALLWSITYFTPYRLISFEAAKDALDLNVLLLLAGMMAVVGVLKTTGVFPWAVARLLQRSGGQPRVIQRMVMWFTGVLSAFLDNVTTVIFVTPMASEMAVRTGIRPVVYLLPMVMASNIGGTATLIGDPPNVMIGSGAHLSFLEFIRNLTLPVIFMMVALEWFAARYYRADLKVPATTTAVTVPGIKDPRLLRWALVILAGIFLGFFTHTLTGMEVAVPAVIGAALMLIVQDVLYVRRVRPSHTERIHGLIDIIEKEIEWPTLSFFAFLFIAVGAAVHTGLIDTMARGLAWTVDNGRQSFGLSENGTLLFAALLICWASGFLSALIDNIPYVAVAIPLVARLVTQLPGDTEVLWWALSLGACLGGNGTAIGASANVTTIGLAERAGIRISFLEFTRFGASVTALTLLISSVFLWAHIYFGANRTLLWGLAALAAILALRTVGRRVSGKQ